MFSLNVATKELLKRNIKFQVYSYRTGGTLLFSTLIQTWFKLQLKVDDNEGLWWCAVNVHDSIVDFKGVFALLYFDTYPSPFFSQAPTVFVLFL